MGELTRLDDARLPQLLHWLPVDDYVLKHLLPMFHVLDIAHFLQARPGNRPNQVCLRYVPSTSYRFLQTPALAADALASRIQFPMNRA
jgi:hypothetical protein